MASFEQAIEFTLPKEGGYVNNPHDHGGETLFGIARNRHPEWSGWNRVDELKKHFGADPKALAGVLSADGGLLENAKQFYEENFWQYDDIVSQAVANKLFDTGVNTGVHEAVKLLQRALRVEDDGKFGPHTLEATNAANSSVLLNKLRGEQKQYYDQLIAKNPDEAVFRHNWYKRAES